MRRGWIFLLILGFLIFKLVDQINFANAQVPQDSVYTPPSPITPLMYDCKGGNVAYMSTQSPEWSCQACDCGVYNWQSCPTIYDSNGQPVFTVVQGIHSSKDAWGKQTCYAYCYGLAPNCQWKPMS